MKCRSKYGVLMILPVLLLFLNGCLPGVAQGSAVQMIYLTPTLNPVFMGGEGGAALSTSSTGSPASATGFSDGTPQATKTVPSKQAGASVTPTPEQVVPPVLPTQAPSATPTPGPTATPLILPTLVVYDDRLNSNWSLNTSTGGTYYLQNQTAAQSGEYAITFTPTQDFGNLAFTVKFNTKETYLREEILGVRFWLYSEEGEIGADELAVSVVGSNEYPYWKWNDTSVTNTSEPIFSETRLYDLDFNAPIPPKTWVQVEIWLDELKFDPLYQYVTGIFIKTGEGFRNPITIDQVELVKAPGL